MSPLWFALQQFSELLASSTQKTSTKQSTSPFAHSHFWRCGSGSFQHTLLPSHGRNTRMQPSHSLSSSVLVQYLFSYLAGSCLSWYSSPRETALISAPVKLLVGPMTLSPGSRRVTKMVSWLVSADLLVSKHTCYLKTMKYQHPSWEITLYWFVHVLCQKPVGFDVTHQHYPTAIGDVCKYNVVCVCWPFASTLCENSIAYQRFVVVAEV